MRLKKNHQIVASWTLYEGPDKPNAWLSSDWSKSEVEGIANVTFTVEKAGDGFGSTINYLVDAGTELDRNVNIVDTNSENTIEVFWNSESGFGKIRSKVFFENDLFHCWDSTFNDAACD